MLKKSLWVAIAALGMLAGCANQKEPAQQAIASVEAELAEVRTDASRFAKEQLDSVEGALASLRAKSEAGEYKEVIAEAPEVTKQVNSLKETVAAKRTEFEAATAQATQEWNALSAQVPKYVDTLQKRVDQLVKSRKIERGVSKESLDLDSVRNTWADAGNLFSSGQAVEASAKAAEAKARAMALAEHMKIKLSDS